MTPFVPPPPICAARRFQEAGSTTRNRIGFADGARSTGAMDPSTAQYAGVAPDAATHRGGFSATPETGWPMAEIGMAVPTLSTEQFASEIISLPSLVASCLAAALIHGVVTNRRTMVIHFCVLFGIAEVSNTNGISRHIIRRDDPLSNRSQNRSPPRRACERDRHHDRVVRLFHLRYGRRGRIRAAVLST